MPSSSQVGASCEHLVAADLLRRGLEVTKPLVDTGDDLHVRLSRGWVSVQVKARDRRRKKWRQANGRRVISELLALVDPATLEIRYDLVGAELPMELK